MKRMDVDVGVGGWPPKKFNTKMTECVYECVFKLVSLCVFVQSRLEVFLGCPKNQKTEQPSNLASSYRRVYSYQGKIIICHESR